MRKREKGVKGQTAVCVDGCDRSLKADSFLTSLFNHQTAASIETAAAAKETAVAAAETTAAAVEWTAFGGAANRLAYQVGLAPAPAPPPPTKALPAADPAADADAPAPPRDPPDVPKAAALPPPPPPIPLDLAARLAQDAVGLARALLPSLAWRGRGAAPPAPGDPAAALSTSASDARAWIDKWRQGQGQGKEGDDTAPDAATQRVLSALVAAEAAAAAASDASGRLDAALRGASAALASIDSGDDSDGGDETSAD